MRRRATAFAFGVWLTLTAGTAGAERAALRYARPVEAASGWTRLELPEDVLDACRPGLPDLRLYREDAELAFTRGSGLASIPAELPLTDVEARAGLETTALVDRGAHPPLAEHATLIVTDEELLKPVVVEASDDRATWAEIARGSIFALAPRAGGARMTTLHFAPNDRRFFRFRLDDRNGAAAHPRAVVLGDVARETPPRERALEARPVSGGDGAISLYTVLLPSGNLPLVALRVALDDAAFVRRARVYERVVFRDEVARRLVGEGTVFRSAAQRANDLVFVGDVAGKVLEIEIDHGGSPPTRLAGITALTVPREILFHAPEGARVELAYGSSSLPRGSYDLGSAFALGRPKSARLATLGPTRETGARDAPLAPPPRGAPLDVSAWGRRASVVLPAGGSVAYIDLEPSMALREGEVRLVDASKRAVPYLFERTPRHVRRDPHIDVVERGSRTVVTLRELGPPQALEALEISAKAPSYFLRDVSVWQEERDARGVTGRRMIGAARWERRLDDAHAPAPLRIPLHGVTVPSLDVEIDNGDNAALTLGAIVAEATVRRLDFVFEPGDALTLLMDNPRVTAPQYDLALVADAVLAAPAQPARLVALDDAPKPTNEPRVPRWFWGAVVAAGVLVALALARTLRGDGDGDGDEKRAP